MRRSAILFFALALSGSVFALDMPATAAAPVYNWTGFYLGAQVGYGFADTSTWFSGFDAGDTPPMISPNGGGVIAGAQAGYNYQFGNWVAGLEADMATAKIRGYAGSVSVNGFTQPTEQNIDWFGTVRGRLGFVPIDGLLVFASGGAAIGGVSVKSNSFPVGGSCSNSSCGSGFTAQTNSGWTAGGGFEYALSNQITIKAEYLFVDLGGLSNTYPITLAVSQATTHSDFKANIVRAGLNLRLP